MARPINHDRLEGVLAKAGFTTDQREAAHAANENRDPAPRGHGAPAPKRVTARTL